MLWIAWSRGRGISAPRVRRSTPAAVGALLTLGFVGEIGAQPPSRAVRIPLERLERITPGAPIPSRVAVIRRGGVDTVGVTARAIVLRRGEFAVLHTGEGARRVRGPLLPRDAPPVDTGESFYALPIRLVTPNPALTGEWVLRPIYKVARMRWSEPAGVFQGALFLAVEDSTRRGESRPLAVPVRFQLLTDGDTIDPGEIALEHTNLPLRQVRVVATRATDSLRVHIVPEFDVGGTDVWIAVEPSLHIETTPRRIQGWGIQTARVVVRVVGASERRPAAASVTASTGDLDTLEVAIGAAGTGVARIRSEGLGEAVLRASAPGLAGATTTIEFTLPWIFGLAALLGAVFGGLAAAARNNQRQRKVSWGKDALTGVLAGLLAAVAWYALGVNVLQIDLGVPRFNEVAVFALAALAAYFGIALTAPKPAG